MYICIYIVIFILDISQHIHIYTICNIHIACVCMWFICVSYLWFLSFGISSSGRIQDAQQVALSKDNHWQLGRRRDRPRSLTMSLIMAAKHETDIGIPRVNSDKLT